MRLNSHLRKIVRSSIGIGKFPGQCPRCQHGILSIDHQTAFGVALADPSACTAPLVDRCTLASYVPNTEMFENRWTTKMRAKPSRGSLVLTVARLIRPVCPHRAWAYLYSAS
jgi:hypothetical protein